MKKKRIMMCLMLFLFLLISIKPSYAKVVAFYNQNTNQTEYYSDYDKEQTFTNRQDAYEYDNELKEENDINNDAEDEDSEEDGGFFKFPDIGKMIQDWLLNTFKSIAENTVNPNSETSGLRPDGMFLNNVINLEKHLPILGRFYETLSIYFKSIALSVVILYALWYGFKVYVLWKDGNPEENPVEMAIRFIVALSLIIAGEELLQIITIFISSVVNKIINISNETSGGSIIDMIIKNVSFGIFIPIIFEAIYFFQYWKMMLNTVMLGIEFYVLKLIMPLTCVNLVSPQANTWNAYVSTLIKASAGICLNVLLLSIGVKIHDTSAGNIFCGLWASAFLITANKSKELLNQFIVGTHNNMSGSSVMGTAGQIIHIGEKIGMGMATGGAGALKP